MSPFLDYTSVSNVLSKDNVDAGTRIGKQDGNVHYDFTGGGVAEMPTQHPGRGLLNWCVIERGTANRRSRNNQLRNPGDDLNASQQVRLHRRLPADAQARRQPGPECPGIPR